MTFKDVLLDGTYDTGFGEIDIIKEFYSPILEQSKRYDRVAGYFSSRVLASAARGIAGLVRNNGRMRLITSHAFTPKDTKTLQNHFSLEHISENLINEFLESYKKLESLSKSIAKNHVAAMCWMLREGFLEIKVVIPESADLTALSPDELEKFHPKFGIFSDFDGNIVAFSGSVNETESAWKRNIENLDVYQNWIPGESKWIDPKILRFEKLWNGQISNKWRIIDLPTAVKDKIVSEFAPVEFPTELEELQDENSFDLREYQLDALNEWVKADRRGILEMATGTGKTRTAKACIQSTSKLGSLLTVVVVPYQHIGDQWAKELSSFKPLILTDGWRKKISEAESDVKLGRISDLLLIVVKNTAGFEDFISALKSISLEFQNTLLIGDEVHWLGARDFQNSLISFANFRLGLSATPIRYFDEEGTDYIVEYFGGSVYKLSIKEALKITDEQGQPILCPYEYNPLFVSLSKSELDVYRDLTAKINKLSFMLDDYDVRNQLTILRNQRSAVTKKAESKIPAFRRLIIDLPKPLKQCIVYCADKSQLQQVAEIMHEFKIDTQQITGEESTSKSDKWDGMNEREYILKNFANEKLGVLLAIRCLDEGVDIPSARLGVILASSGNSKEFIQRRGRLMRFFKGKEKATIYDFCVLPLSKDDPIGDLGLVKVELNRIGEFAEDATNQDEVLKLVDSYLKEM